MPLGFYYDVSLLTLLFVARFHCTYVPEGVSFECRDRYLWVSIEKPLADHVVGIEAFDDTGVYPLTERYESECGYTRTRDDFTGNSILRASYLSCHTNNLAVDVFVFNFNLITVDDDVRHSVPLSQTCTLSLPWSPREMICEHKYMEVSIGSTSCTYFGGSPKVVGAHKSSLVYKVVFRKGGEEVASMSIEDARLHGYVIETIAGRVVFRAAYAQPDSEIKMVNGIPVEVVHATVFIQKSWVVMMIDVTGACTANLPSFDGDRLLWQTPLMTNSSEYISQHMRLGVEAELLDMSTLNDWGYRLDVAGDLVWITVPYSAKGGIRWSFVQQNMYHEYYSVNLYYEHMFMDGHSKQTRCRQVKRLASPLLFQVPFTIDQTIVEEHHFTVYLGNFPFDVELLAVVLNGEPFTVPEATLSGYPITTVPHSNGTHAYVIRVPFEDALVPKVYFTEGILQYSLTINYTLNIMPQDPYYHSASVIAQIKDLFPPDFNGVCTDNGIIFKMTHQKMGYLWETCIGHYPLTHQLATQRGYFLHNDSQSMILEVPVFTIGYIYENIGLKQFYGTFEILSRDAKTWELQKSTAKRCLFKTDELIVCAPNGVVTVVASMTVTLPDTEARRATLLDTSCGPEDFDETRVLFTFRVNTCGTRVTVDDSYITYENEILVSRELLPEWAPVITRDADYRLTIRCHYPVNDVNGLFVDRKFKSGTPGFGSITPTSGTKAYVPKTTARPQHVPRTTTAPPPPKTTAPPTTTTAPPPPKATAPPTTTTAPPPPKATAPPTTVSEVTTKYVPVKYIRVSLG